MLHGDTTQNKVFFTAKFTDNFDIQAVTQNLSVTYCKQYWGSFQRELINWSPPQNYNNTEQ
jgi:hypothetical protein